MTFKTAPDYESPTDTGGNNVYNIQVQASDGGLNDTQNIAITVADVNEAPIITSGSTVSVAENSTLVMTLTATDEDLPGDSLTWSKTGAGADDSAFTIVSDQLSFSSAPDFESPTDTGTNNTYVVDVQVADGNGGTDTQTITVTVTDVNEAPSVALSGTVTSVAENTGTPLKVADIVITDDALQGTNGNALSLTGADASAFEISGTDLQFKATTTLDFETQNSYSVAVAVDDDEVGVTPDDTTTTLTVNLTDVNEAPTIDTNSGSNLSEGGTDPITDLELASSDVDDLDSSLQYTVTSGPTYGQIEVSGSPGSIFTQGQIDGGLVTYVHDDTENFSDSFDFKVEDGGEDGVVAPTGTFTIGITPANDNAPVITSASTANVAENTTSVLTFTATDADLPADSFTWSKTGGVDQAFFTISGDQLSFSSAPDFENALDSDGNNTYIVDIQVSDGTNTTPQTITVTVTDVNEAPSVSGPESVTKTEDDPVFSLNLLTNASDEDAGDVLDATNISLTSGDDAGVTIDDLNNELDVDPNAYNSLAVGESIVVSYSYDVVDGNGGSVGQTASITINGVNDSPVVSGPESATQTEDDATFSLNLLTNASDPDSSDVLDATTIVFASGNSAGVTIDDVNNELDVDPSAYNSLADGESAAANYNYNVVDGNGGSVGQSATVTINGVNDQPVAGDVGAAANEDGVTVDGSFSVTDVDSTDTHTFTIQTLPSEGSVVN
ncbi:MAG: cadherin-like domain-containing protein, partial [Pseudomonadales bacterium]|nr:cadherin-like domain-containing protein [Pseudomonadales bacterium]